MFKFGVEFEIEGIEKLKISLARNMNVEKLEALASTLLYVGYPENAKTPDGQSIAKYAKANNYGVYTGEGSEAQVRIPPRPFMQNALEHSKYRNARNRYIKTIVNQISMRGLDPQVALNRLGTLVVNHIKSSIRDGEWTPNAPSTLKRKMNKGKSNKKGSPKPLIDTGAMLQATTYVLIPAKKANIISKEEKL